MVKWCTILVSGFADCREMGIAHVFRFLGGSAVPGGLERLNFHVGGGPIPQKRRAHLGLVMGGSSLDFHRTHRTRENETRTFPWAPSGFRSQNEAGRLPGCLGVLGCVAPFSGWTSPKTWICSGGFPVGGPVKPPTKRGVPRLKNPGCFGIWVFLAPCGFLRIPWLDGLLRGSCWDLPWCGFLESYLRWSLRMGPGLNSCCFQASIMQSTCTHSSEFISLPLPEPLKLL